VTSDVKACSRRDGKKFTMAIEISISEMRLGIGQIQLLRHSTSSPMIPQSRKQRESIMKLLSIFESTTISYRYLKSIKFRPTDFLCSGDSTDFELPPHFRIKTASANPSLSSLRTATADQNL
jgi:hypothetical protein